MSELKTDAIEKCIAYYSIHPESTTDADNARAELAELLAALHTAEVLRKDADKEVARLGKLLRDKCSDAEECPLFYSEKNYQDAIAEAEKWKRGYDDGCDIITSLRAEVAAAEERVWRVARRLCANCYNMNEPFYGRDVADYKTYAAAKAAEAKENKK